MKVALGEVCKARSSLVDPTRAEFRDLPHVAPDSVERNSGRILDVRSAAEDRVTSGKYRFEPGDVLYSKIRPNLNKVVEVDFAGLCSADMYALDVDPSRALARYILYGLRGRDFVAYATALSNRASIPKLNREQLMRYEFELPPLDEQRHVVAVLDHADALRAKCRQLQVHLDDLPQSIFHEMFGDPESASRKVRFGDLAALRGGRSLVADDLTAESAFRVLKISAVTSGSFKVTESKALPEGYEPPADHLVRTGDLLMSRANTADLVGAVAYVHEVPPNIALPDKIWRFDWCEPESVQLFYHSLFHTPSVRRRISQMASGTGGSMKNVSKAKLENLMLPDVGINRQRAFDERVRSIPQSPVARYDELFASLQSRAFSGTLG